MVQNPIFSWSVACLIQNILVAVDGSPESTKALDFSLDLAEKYGAEVAILNVSELPALGAGSQTTAVAYASDSLPMPVYTKDLNKLHEEVLSKALLHARETKPNVEVYTRLRDGDPALEIVAMAKEENFDVVVVAHKGMGRVREALLGSISEKVAHLASCPVIIVR